MSKTHKRERSDEARSSKAFKAQVASGPLTQEEEQLIHTGYTTERELMGDLKQVEINAFYSFSEWCQRDANALGVPFVMIYDNTPHIIHPEVTGVLLQEALDSSVADMLQEYVSASATSDIGQLDLEIGQLPVNLSQDTANSYSAGYRPHADLDALEYTVEVFDANGQYEEYPVIGAVAMLREFWKHMAAVSASDVDHDYREIITDPWTDSPEGLAVIDNMVIGFCQDLSADEIDAIIYDHLYDPSDTSLPKGVYVFVNQPQDDQTMTAISRCVIESAKSYAGICVDQAGYRLTHSLISRSASDFHIDDMHGNHDPEYIAWTASEDAKEQLRGHQVYGVHPHQEPYYINL